MTPTELRELDAWIAEHVMGWRLVDRPTKCVQQQHWNGMKWPAMIPPCQPLYDFSIPEYSTDPAASQMVLEKCLKRGDTITSGFYNGKYWFALGSSKTAAEDESLPLAIAKFAKELFKKD